MECVNNDPVRNGNDADMSADNTLLPHNEQSKLTTGILNRCLYDPVHKRKVLHSVCITLLFTALGMTLGQIGPTLLDLQIVTNVDLETSSFFLTAFALGFTIGCAFSGIFYDKVNKNCLLLTSVLGLGLFTIITPYCFYSVVMIFVRALVGICHGVLRTGAIAEQMRVWGKEGTGLMHLIYFGLAFGEVISPLYTAPFLAETAAENSTYRSLVNYTALSTVVPETQPTTTDVRYAFIICGIICFLSGIPWLLIYLQDKFVSKWVVFRPDEVVTKRKLSAPVFMHLICMICLIYFFHSCVQCGLVSFLTAFLVKEYNEPKSKGAYLTAAYYASLAVSRFVLIFISHKLTAVHLLSMSCFFTMTTSVCFTISARFSVVDALVFFTILYGFGISAVYPAGISWTESHLMKVTSRVFASIEVSTAVGAMVNPVIFGYLMENVSNMFFCYLLVIETALMCFVFLTLFVTFTFYINKHEVFQREISISGETQVSEAN